MLRKSGLPRDTTKVVKLQKSAAVGRWQKVKKDKPLEVDTGDMQETHGFGAYLGLDPSQFGAKEGSSVDMMLTVAKDNIYMYAKSARNLNMPVVNARVEDRKTGKAVASIENVTDFAALNAETNFIITRNSTEKEREYWPYQRVSLARDSGDKYLVTLDVTETAQVYSTLDEVPAVYILTGNLSCNILLVAPNFIDLTDVELFLEFFTNPVMIMLVILIWNVYFMGIWFFRKHDEMDEKKVYARVYMYLKGTLDKSRVHRLTGKGQKLFMEGAENWFLVTTPTDLGNLKSVVVWHDNSGDSAAWFLKEVYVHKVDNKKSWHCLYDDWLSLEHGHGHLVIEAPALTPEEIHMRRMYQFALKTSTGLRTGHLWLSIFFKPPYKPEDFFQREEPKTYRYVSPLKDYDPGTLNTEELEVDQRLLHELRDDLAIAYFDAVDGTIEELDLLGLGTLTMRSVPSQKRHHVRDEYMNRRYHYYPADPSLSPEKVLLYVKRQQASAMKREYVQMVVEAQLAENANKNANSDAGNVMLNRNASAKTNASADTEGGDGGGGGGGKDGVVVNIEGAGDAERVEDGNKQPQETAKMDAWAKKEDAVYEWDCVDRWSLPWWFIYLAWIVTLGISIFNSYVVMLYGLHIGYQASIDWVVSFFTAWSNNVFVLQPQKVVFLSLIFVIVLRQHVDVQKAASLRLTDEFGDLVHKRILRDFERRKMLMGHLWHDPQYPHPIPANRADDIRVRLAKDTHAQSIIREALMYVFFIFVVAFAALGHLPVPDAEHNNVVVKNLFKEAVAEDAEIALEDVQTTDDMWTYLTDTLPETMYVAREDVNGTKQPTTTFSLDQYVLGPVRLRQLRHADQSGSIDCSDTETILKYLHSRNWVDLNTRAIFVDFNLYNPNRDLLASTTIMFELSVHGQVMPTFGVVTTKLRYYYNEFEQFVFTCELLFLLMIGSYIYFEVKLMSPWSWIELAIISFAIACIVFHIRRLILVYQFLALVKENQSKTFLSFSSARQTDVTLECLKGGLFSLVVLKVFKMLRFNRHFGVVLATFELARESLINYFIQAIIFLMAFVSSGLLIFGSIVEGYRSVLDCMLTLFNFALGVSDFFELWEAHSTLGPLFYFLFVFFYANMAVSVFVTIVMEAYEVTHVQVSLEVDDRYMLDYVKRQLDLLLGTTPTKKRPEKHRRHRRRAGEDDDI
nr:hypothetical protein BaRGS_035365 [Batillaria attramentaria]